MKRLTYPCFLILLLLTCGLKCNTDVARVMLPELTETPAPQEDADASLFEMEAILATSGQVHSPIPNDVYELLWGRYTKAGADAPRHYYTQHIDALDIEDAVAYERHYYTKYIDADGIAIVGSDLVDDRFFQAARHIVLVMTSKLPGIRDALSIDAPGSIIGDDIPFRLTLTEHFSLERANLPEYQGVDISNTVRFHGVCGFLACRADVWWTESEKWEGKRVSRGALGVITHEMVHAMHYEILEHNLVPDFVERLDAAFLHYTRNDKNTCGLFQSTHARTNHAEFFAHAATDKWLENLFIPPDTTVTWLLRELDMPDTPENRALLAVEPDSPDGTLSTCSSIPMLIDLLAEVFPAVPLQWAIYNRNYNPQESE